MIHDKDFGITFVKFLIWIVLALLFVIVLLYCEEANAQVVESYSIHFDKDGQSSVSTGLYQQVESDMDILFKWNKRMGNGNTYQLYKVNSAIEYEATDLFEDGSMTYTNQSIVPYNDWYENYARRVAAQKLIDNPELIPVVTPLKVVPPVKVIKPPINYDHLFLD